ncbi:MAG: condensation domain protein, partial [Eubacterium sp.]|nr:condensation domain protein [Eubacterium sp.]
LKCMVRYLNRQWCKEKKVFTFDEYRDMCKEYWKNRKTKILVLTLEKDQLHKLKAKSKENGVTVNSTVTTAFLKAASNEAETGIAASVRPHGFEGMGNYASGISIKYRYNTGRNFWSNALIVQKLFSRKLSDNRLKYLLLNFLNELEPNLIDAAYFNSFMGFKSAAASKVSKMFGYKGNPKGVSISNLTKAPIPDSYGRYNIESITFVPPLVPNAKRIIGVVTAGDRMTVAMQVEDGGNIDNEERIFTQAVRELNCI